MGLEDFVVNRKIVFFVSDSILSTITNSSTEVEKLKLDNLESIVFTLLASNANELIPYDKFLYHWRSPEATENSLARVISLLRTKLKMVGLNEKVIINTSKKGYTLVANVEALNPQSENGHNSVIFETLSEPLLTKSTAPNIFTKVKIYSSRFYLGFALIVVTAFMANFLSPSTSLKKTKIQSASFTELVENTDIKLELAYNSIHERVAFSSKAFNGKYWHIEVLYRYTGEKILLTEENKNIRKPAWLSRNELIYRAYDETNCEIRKATFDLSTNKYTAIKLFSCNPNSYASSIAKYNDSQILLTDAEFNNTASNLYIGDINSGKIKQVSLSNAHGVGIYNIVTTDNSNLIALLSSSDGANFKIQLVDPTNEWKAVWEEDLESINISVGWDGTNLSFKNNQGGISIVSFYEDKPIKRTHFPVLGPIHNLSSARTGILLTSGEFKSQDISYANLENSKFLLLTDSSNATNKLANFYIGDTIIYISNKTGVNQIWMHDVDNNSSKQLSAFEQHSNIEHLSLNPSTRQIAIESSGKTLLFSLSENNHSLTNLIEFKGFNPEFFDNHLVFTQYDGNNSNLASLDLTSLAFSEFKIKDGFIAKSDGHQLYYSKNYAPGIWQYLPDDEDKLVLKLPSSAYQWHYHSGKILYQNDIGDFFKYDTSTKQTAPFKSQLCSNPIAFSGERCLSKSFNPSSNKIVLLKWQ